MVGEVQRSNQNASRLTSPDPTCFVRRFPIFGNSLPERTRGDGSLDFQTQTGRHATRELAVQCDPIADSGGHRVGRVRLEARSSKMGHTTQRTAQEAIRDGSG